MDENIKEILMRGVESRDEYIRKVESLLHKSEERIDRTNEMVTLLARTASENNKTLERITEEYCKRIDGLAHTRDVLIEQNGMLIRDLEKSMSACREMNERFDGLIKQLFDLARQKMSSNNINVK